MSNKYTYTNITPSEILIAVQMKMYQHIFFNITEIITRKIIWFSFPGINVFCHNHNSKLFI